MYKDIPECKYNAKLLRFIDLKELHLILLLSAIFFCFFQTGNSGNYTFYAQGQTPPQSTESQNQQTSPSFEPAVSVKITSPTNNQNVSTGQLLYLEPRQILLEVNVKFMLTGMTKNLSEGCCNWFGG